MNSSVIPSADRPATAVGEARYASAAEQTLDQLVACEAEVLGNVAEHPGQSPDRAGRVPRPGDMVLAAVGGGEAKMALGLTGQPEAQDAEGPCTKWSRMIRGA